MRKDKQIDFIRNSCFKPPYFGLNGRKRKGLANVFFAATDELRFLRKKTQSVISRV